MKDAIKKRSEYIVELRNQFQRGEIMVDPDDPRTTIGLSSEEVAFIRGDMDDDDYELWFANGHAFSQEAV